MNQLDCVAKFFQAHEGREVTTLEVFNATGSLACHTKISQLRERGMDIQRTRDEWVSGKRICGYTYSTPRLAALNMPAVAVGESKSTAQSSEPKRHGTHREVAAGTLTRPIELSGGSLVLISNVIKVFPPPGDIFAASALTPSRLTTTPNLPTKDAEFLNQSNNNQKKVRV